jgi:hypothetical protein
VSIGRVDTPNLICTGDHFKRRLGNKSRCCI